MSDTFFDGRNLPPLLAEEKRIGCKAFLCTDGTRSCAAEPNTFLGYAGLALYQFWIMSEVSGSGNNTSQEGQGTAATTDVNLEHAPASNTGDSNADASDWPQMFQSLRNHHQFPATGGPSNDLIEN